MMAEPTIIFENSDFLVVNKSAGLLVHSAHIKSQSVHRKSESTLADWLMGRYPELKKVGDEPAVRPGIVHRLDRETSGVMVVARTQKTFDFLKGLFQRHEVLKTYQALVWGRVRDEEGVIKTPIALKPGTTKRAVRGKNLKMMKEAETAYRVVRRLAFDNNELTLLSVSPRTGRTHQIRVHLSSIEHSVVGDKLYGTSKIKEQKAKMLGITRQFLHADSIEFTAPDGGRMRFSADLPDDLSQALAKLVRAPRDFHLSD